MIDLRYVPGASRRQVLRVGSLGLFGLNLPGLLRAEDENRSKGKEAKQRSCILLWLSGGISQLDSFDPKPDAPIEIRGEFKTIPTTTPGIHFVEHLPKLSRMTKQFSLIRSMTHNQGTHGLADQLVTSGYAPTPSGVGVRYPSHGSVVSWVTGYRDGVPPYVYVGDISGPDGFRKRDALNAGVLGAQYNPLEIGDKANDAGFRVRDVTPPKGVDAERMGSRLAMLEKLDRWQRSGEARLPVLKEVDSYYEKAFSLVTSPRVKKAFQLEEESAKLRDAYGRTMFGQSCLLARRLVEAGVRYVTVGMPGWDTHTDNFRDMKNKLLPVLDMAYSALLQDTHDRGLVDSTLIVCMGEFGRTPKINAEAGRDHWPATQVFALGGGGVKTGVVVGATNERSEYPTERPVSVQDFSATVYRSLGISPDLSYPSTDNRPTKVLAGGEAISELIS
ncbi:MAG: DUF1501 domain-containing protein [Acidobacteria bacterium]|nr:DUF1501 domain-containing protein [Acidobacteriota bacterium]